MECSIKCCSREYRLLIRTFWPTATIHQQFHLLMYYPAQRGRQQQWSRGGKWLKVWNLPSSENSFFVEAKGMPQISFAEHCGSGRKGASNSSKLKQVKKSKQDGYSFLSHPSQALTDSFCSCLPVLNSLLCRRSCSLLRSFAVPQPPTVKYFLIHLSCCTVSWRSYWTAYVSFHSNLQRQGPVPSTDLRAL